ncbi:MAG TPA: hypothetical protein VJ838_10800 [Gaiellaceae bacterium]|nr:hypothetical protein [Gaiellaceae bacterium]
MKPNVDTALAAANPFPSQLAVSLPLMPGEEEMLSAIVTRAPLERGVFSRLRRGRVVRLSVALALVAVVAVAALIGTRGSRPSPAYAAELVRLANESPLLLLDEPGWKVTYVNEDSAQDGEMRFTKTVDGAATTVSLHWRSGALADWISDRADSATATSKTQVLGATATVFADRPAGATSLWVYDGRVMEFTTQVGDMRSLDDLLGALKPVSTDAWIQALPPDAVPTADRAEVVAQMLRGIPLPPGFTAADVPGKGLTNNRYQLGADVAGAVACTWLKQWSQARTAGDEAKVQQAIDAMATAPSWPILQEMRSQGAYPEVLDEFAKAMPSGTWYGRPLAGDADSGLGCRYLGIPLR